LGYDRVLLAESGDGVLGIDCEPILVRDAEELLSRDDARAALGAGDEPAVVAVLPAEATPGIDELLAEVDVPLLRSTHYPLLELMNGVDGLVGTAGYNLFHEARACGVPAAWLWHAKGDDQPLRVANPVGNAADITSWASALRPRTGARADYRNGAWTAARHVERLLR
jgi:hypothetical protein